MPETDSSSYFSGKIGVTVAAATFPVENYLIDDTRYSYEGNWAFCRFDSDEIPGARFGFGRGGFDATDYGAAEPTSRSFLMLHLELMTAAGAVLWLGTGKYSAEQVRLAPGRLDAQLRNGTHDIFRVRGWPDMEWHFETDNREAEVHMTCRLPSVTILPDCVMPHNLFAMWLAVAPVKGEARFRDRRMPLTGTMFYDHPRINVVAHAGRSFGWYLYMPMRLADGGSLIAYYTEDAHGRPAPDYCFGLHIDPHGAAIWLPRTELLALTLDADNKPNRWEARWQAGPRTWTAQCAVRPTGILKAWGGKDVPQTRRANGNIPLVFDVAAAWRDGRQGGQVIGGGLAEYVPRAGIPPPISRVAQASH